MFNACGRPTTRDQSEQIDQLHRAGYRRSVALDGIGIWEHEAGLVDEDVARTALDFHDTLLDVLNAPRPSKTPAELRAKSARIEAEFGTPTKARR
jgi:hypothetical protein